MFGRWDGRLVKEQSTEVSTLDCTKSKCCEENAMFWTSCAVVFMIFLAQNFVHETNGYTCNKIYHKPC